LNRKQGLLNKDKLQKQDHLPHFHVDFHLVLNINKFTTILINI